MGTHGYIYIIENDVNDKLYVGQTIYPYTRWKAHCHKVLHTSVINSPYRKKTQCVNGHLLDQENTYICTRKDGRTYRRCYTCMKASNRKSYCRRQLKSKRGS